MAIAVAVAGITGVEVILGEGGIEVHVGGIYVHVAVGGIRVAVGGMCVSVGGIRVFVGICTGGSVGA